jgi:hypothetical protein
MIRSVLLSFVFIAPAFAQDIQLHLPVACEVGRNCLVQHYVDLDASSAARDYQCGSLTYDGHDGTDFRVPTVKAAVDVLAAAPGRVLRLRDGVPDVSVRVRGREQVEGAECGNGVVVAHEGGWETQYCHMAKGSLAVRSGDTVTAGQPLGRVGMSGLAEFPHLHFAVRRDGKVVDPFAPEARPGACGSATSLWDDPSRKALAYEASSVLNVGFATGPVTMEQIESGDAGAAPPGRDAPALVAFVRAIGLKGGDVQIIRLIAPDGSTLRQTRTEPLDRDKAQYMLFLGLRRPETGWTGGRYRAIYTVLRGGKPALERAFALEMNP